MQTKVKVKLKFTKFSVYYFIVAFKRPHKEGGLKMVNSIHNLHGEPLHSNIRPVQETSLPGEQTFHTIPHSETEIALIKNTCQSCYLHQSENWNPRHIDQSRDNTSKLARYQSYTLVSRGQFDWMVGMKTKWPTGGTWGSAMTCLLSPHFNLSHFHGLRQQ